MCLFQKENCLTLCSFTQNKFESFTPRIEGVDSGLQWNCSSTVGKLLNLFRSLSLLSQRAFLSTVFARTIRSKIFTSQRRARDCFPANSTLKEEHSVNSLLPFFSPSSLTLVVGRLHLFGTHISFVGHVCSVEWAVVDYQRNRGRRAPVRGGSRKTAKVAHRSTELGTHLWFWDVWFVRWEARLFCGLLQWRNGDYSQWHCS